jgi:NitT/TauT family transport system substrate-binding protein
MKKLLIALLFLSTLPFFLSCAEKQGHGKKVRLAYIQNDLHHLPAFVALEKGYYREEGLNVEIAGIFRAGPEEMSAFSSHSLDAGYVGEAPVITAQANKVADVRIVAQANKEGSALVAAKDSPIKNIGDLRGKVVAIPGHATIQDVLLRMALKRSGIKPTELTIMVLKPPEMLSALSSREIDAFIAWEPYPSKAVTGGTGKVILDSGSIWKDHPCCALIVDRNLMQDRDVVRGLIRAHVKAVRFIRDNGKEAERIGARYTGMDEITVGEALKRIKFDPVPSRDDQKEFIEFLKSLGYIKLENSDDFIDKLMDISLLNEIEKDEKTIR